VNNKLCFFGFGLALAAFGCSANSNENISRPPGHGGAAGAGGGGGAGDSTTSSAGASGSLSTGVGGGGLGITVVDAGATTSNGCTPTPEVCDGKDNDCNGIIDDVDVGKDGVCDCLNIATIGEPGPWDESGGTNIFTDWLNSRSPTPAVALGDKVLTDELLKPFQVVVTLHAGTMDAFAYTTGKTATKHHPFSDAEVQAYTKWVNAGGGSMSTIAYVLGGKDDMTGTLEQENINKLLSMIGLSYKGNWSPGPITDWVMDPVTNGVQKITATNGMSCDDMGTVVARDQFMNCVLQIKEVGMGHVAMWADDWITYNTLWQNLKDEQVERLWLNVIKYLTPPKQCQVPIPDRIN
jgi:hypothetical protein